jgi:hypothetical protein
MITLQYDAITINLPDDLHWVDEFSWSPVAQTADYSIGGSLFIEESTKLAGRPITLGGAYDDMGWVRRSVVKQLEVARNILGQQFTLTLKDGTVFTVMFRQEAGAVDARPVIAWDQVNDDDWYRLILKFMEV